MSDDGDEYHTLDELYEYRMLYNAHAANQWAAHHTHPVVKSWRHSDGQPCFGGGWFIVVATLPDGQASNHYAAEHWDLFAIPEVQLPPEYDGHTPQQAAQRLRAALTAPSRCTTLACQVPVAVRGIYDDGLVREEASYCTECAKVLAAAGEFTPDVEHRCTTTSTVLGRWTAYCACGWASTESSNEGWVFGEYRKHAGEQP